MRWKLFQSVVFVGVGGYVASQKLNPNPIVAGVIALVATMLATLIVAKAIDLTGWLLRLRLKQRERGGAGQEQPSQVRQARV